MKSQLYIGLISGTSMDAIDAALVSIDESSCTLKASVSHAYRKTVHPRLVRLIDEHRSVSLHEIGQLHVEIARDFADAARTLMQKTGISSHQIAAIGSHGQTVMHDPDGPTPFSLQLGDPATIATLTGATVVADFRGGDIALSGQGAPLVPAFHRWAFGDSVQHRAVVNIGGIANVTQLPVNGATSGFDTGPGNVLLDQWCRKHRNTAFDNNGEWGAGGSVNQELLKKLRSDGYFARVPPKSTGTDYFNTAWLTPYLQTIATTLDPQDVQATLGELTASTIADAIGDAQSIGICGGGAANSDLLARLKRLLPGRSVQSTGDWGIDPDWVEAMAFAWLAHQRLRGEPGNLPAVTGARATVSLGGIYQPPDS